MKLAPLVKTSPSVAVMRQAPIDPSWILAGTPVARCASLSRSEDGTSWTDAWDCTAGAFEWRYGCDETINIQEGHATITDQDGAVWNVGPGDVIFFRTGTRARWVIPAYVRKVAFCRDPLPRELVVAMKARDKLRRRPFAAAAAALAGLLAATLPLAELIVAQ
jgi:uncharacterized cupin superfamily protein